ncbi:MAG: hypothetical protein LBV07_01880, partial [Syntrophobacterales bacterium]|nr:hypothetical protein [Syntrophobacterales bacterium]
MKRTIESALRLQKTPAGKILAALEQGQHVTLRGLQEAAKSFLMSHIFSRQTRPLIAVLPTEKEALTFYQDCRVFLDQSHVLRYPAWNIMTTDFLVPQKETAMDRLRVLTHLLQGRKMLVVTSLPALIQNCIPRSVFEEYSFTLAMGDTIDGESLAEKLVLMGYTRQTLVEERGDFSIRGHIVDLFPPHSPTPFRMERMGDEIESIRRFDSVSQRSIEEIVDFQITAASELILTENRRKMAGRNTRIRATDLELPRRIKDPLMETIDSGLLASLNPMYLPLF